MANETAEFDKEVEETKAKMGVESVKTDDETPEAEESKDTEVEQTATKTEEEQDDQTEEETDEVNTEESPDESESESTFKKRFTQFKGETPEEYVPNLEEGYYNSSAEALRLAQENKALREQLELAANPPAQEEQETPTAPPDPAIAYAQKKMKDEMQESYDKFIETYPQVHNDPETRQKVDAAAKQIAELHFNQTQEYMDFGELLNMAAAYLKLTPDTSEDVASAAKDSAAMSKSATGGKKPVAKTGLTAQQLEVGKKMGLSEKQLEEYYSKK